MPQTNPWEEDWSRPTAAPAPQQGPIVLAPPPAPTPPSGYQPTDGGLTYVPGGPADPAVIARNGAAGRAPPDAPAGDVDQAAVRAEALQKIALARSLIERSRNGWFTTGFGASTMSNFSGSGAYDVAQDIETLRASGALSRVMEMAATNGGKNPLTPLSNADLTALGNSIANLDVGQSDEQFQRNLNTYIDMYSRAFRAAGGDDRQLQQVGGVTQRRDDNSLAIPNTAGVGADPSAPTGGVTPRGSGPTTQSPPALRGLSMEIRQMLAGGAPLDQIQQHYRQRLADAGYPNADVSAPLGSIAYAYRELQANPRKNLNEILSGWDALDTITTPAEDVNAAQSFLGNIADSNIGAAAISAGNAASGGLLRNMGSDYGTVLDTQRNERPVSAFTGDLVGSTAAIAGLGKAGTALGAGRAVTGLGGIGLDAGYGAFRGFNEAPEGQGLAGAAIGGVAGLAGNALGQGASPVANAFLDTGVGNATANAFLAAQNRVANGARAIAGRQAQPRGMFAAPRRPTGGEQMLAGAITDSTDIIAQLDAARANNVPLALADTTDSLRGLAGAAYRRASPEVRDPIATSIRGRALDQSDRGQGYIADVFGPIANPNEIADSLTQQARTAARPLYEAAYARSAPVDPTINELLSRPVGQQALQNARTIAMNEGRDPNALGFGMNDLGEITYEQAPSYQSLDYIKRGIDGVVEQRRDPVTGRLPTNDPAFSAVADFRGAFVRRLDELNPDYAAARQAYAGPVRMRDAMQSGRDALGMQPRDINVQMGRLGTPETDMYRLGARVQMGDILGNQRDTVNPFNRLSGSPVARERLSTVFSPDQAGRFGQIADMEGNIGRTTTELLGGSQTASRQMADQQFGDGIMGNIALGTAETMATGAPWTTVMRQGAFQALKDRRQLGLGAQRRADELLPTLTLDNPDDASRLARQILADVNARRSYVQRNRRRGGMFGTAATTAIAAPVIAGQ